MNLAEHEFRGADLASVFRRPGRPWVPLRISEDEEIISVPTGALVTLTAPSGGGKTSLAVQAAWTHALHTGPVVYISREMDAEELGARIVAQRCGVSWGAALRREMDVMRSMEALTDLARLCVLEHDAACIERLEAHVASLRQEYPGLPILAIVDYLQIMPRSGGRDERTQVAGAVEAVRGVTKRLGLVTLALSQSSRAGARALAAGERIGAETTDAGAETAQIERAAHATLALGTMKMAPDGNRTLDLSIGKNRMGDGDRVQPVTFDGATGLFRLAGPAATASAVRGQRNAATLTSELHEQIGRNPGLSRDAICGAIGKRRQVILDAIKTELSAGRIEDRDGMLYTVPGSHS